MVLAGGIIVGVVASGGAGRQRNCSFYGICNRFFLAITILLVKFLFRRPRPEGDWGQVYRVNDPPHSFPSGHAARAAAIVVVVARFLPWWVVLIVAVWAILVGYSRVALKVHYLSDVLFGFLFGAIFAFGMLWVFARLMQIFPPKIARFLLQGFWRR